MVSALKIPRVRFSSMDKQDNNVLEAIILVMWITTLTSTQLKLSLKTHIIQNLSSQSMSAKKKTTAKRKTYSIMRRPTGSKKTTVTLQIIVELDRTSDTGVDDCSGWAVATSVRVRYWVKPNTKTFECKQRIR